MSPAGSRGAFTWSSVTRLKHIEVVGAHPGRRERPVWELLFQSVQLGGPLVFPRKIVGSNGHRDGPLGLLLQDLAEKGC